MSSETTSPSGMQRDYWCFISYRHADNKQPGRQWASWLHHSLETYEVPPDLVGSLNERGDTIPERIFPVFRDEEELPADAQLSKTIEAALARSRFLVVLSSPHAVVSRFVADEIVRFKQLHIGNEDRILAAIIAGDPTGTEVTDISEVSEISYDRRQCFPLPLRFRLERDGQLTNDACEPIASDFRLPDGSEGFTSPAAYRNQVEKTGQASRSEINALVATFEQRTELMKLKIIAGLLGVPLGVLTERDKAYQLDRARKRARALRLWLTLVALLAVVAGIAAFVAMEKRQEAETQRQVAKDQSERRRILLEEAARSDQLRAQDLFAQDRGPEALAYLSRSQTYAPDSLYAPEMAVVMLNGWRFPLPRAICAGHVDEVSSAKFSADGRYLVTASNDKTARVWDVASGKIISVLEGHQSAVQDAEFSPDGKQVITASSDQTARVWDTLSGKSIGVFSGFGSVVWKAFYTAKGERIVTSSEDGKVKLWEAQTGKPICTIVGRSPGFSPDEKSIVTCSPGADTAQVWAAEDGRLLLTLAGHTSGVMKAQFNNDGTRIVTASLDKTARLWDARDGKLLGTLEGHENFVTDAEFSPDGQRIVTVSEEKVARIWDVKEAKLISLLQGHAGTVLIARFSPDGQRVATCSADKTTRIWDVSSATTLAILQGHEEVIFDAQFTPNGREIATASVDHTVRLWGADEHAMTTKVESPHIASEGRHSPDGKHFVINSGKTPMICATDGASLPVDLVGHEGEVHSILYSPDGKHVATGSDDKTARIWNAESGQLEVVCGGHDTGVRSVQFSSDSRHLVTGSANKTRVWECESGKLLRTIPGKGFMVLSAQFSPDNARIVTDYANREALVWDAASGELLATLAGADDSMFKAQFSPDGRLVVTALSNGPVQVWDAINFKLISTMKGHQSGATSVRFNRDSSRIVTSSYDNTARMWEARTGRLLATIHGGANAISFAAFGSGDQCIVTSSLDDSAQSWELLCATSPPPAWFPSFLNLIGQRKFSVTGELATMSASELVQLRAALEPTISTEHSRYAAIARWSLTPLKVRPPRPSND